MEIRQINVYDLIDSRRIGRRQYFIVAFCALLMLFDGFDTQVISFIVPVLANEWHLPKVFSAQLRVGTFLLWAVFAINLATFYFLQSWLPTVLASISFPPALVVWATITVIIGGIVASLLMGPIMDRTSPYRILSTAYVGGAVSMYAISIAIGSSHLALLTTIFLCGICISGGQTCAIALCTLFYSPELRAPGVAWAYGFGRLGAAGGTYLAGVLYANSWTADAMFRVAAAPILVAAACVALMGACYGLTKKDLTKSFSA